MLPDTTQFTWIIRRDVTLQHVEGLRQALVQQGAIAEADLRVLVIDETSAVLLPAGFILPSGEVLPSGLLTTANLPTEGILLQGVFDLGSVPE